MATDLENLRTIKSNLISRLAEVTASKKPSYNIDGKNVNWTEYAAMLRQEIANVNELIALESPFEFKSQGFS